MSHEVRNLTVAYLLGNPLINGPVFHIPQSNFTLYSVYLYMIFIKDITTPCYIEMDKMYTLPFNLRWKTFKLCCFTQVICFKYFSLFKLVLLMLS